MSARVTPGEYAATMAALGRVLEELEETQEIARTAFEPEAPPMSGDDPLEATQPIYPEAFMRDGVSVFTRTPTPWGGSCDTFEPKRYVK